MMDAFERALAVPVRRPYWKKRIYSLGFVMGGLAAVAAVSFAAVGWERISSPRPASSASSGVTTAAPEPAKVTVPPEVLPSVEMPAVEIPAGVTRFRARVDRALALVSSFALAVSGVALFYRVAVENPKKLRRRIWPGAVLAILLWLAISWGFGVYVSSLGQYTLYYGSLAAVAVLLIWFWLTSLALLVGAELNAQLEGSRI
jgi:membrane protein